MGKQIGVGGFPAIVDDSSGGEVQERFRSTPAARWRDNGEPDPFGDRYDRERASLCGGHMTDDEVANAMYLDPGIANLTAAKDRIRWLSRALEAAISRARGHSHE